MSGDGISDVPIADKHVKALEILIYHNPNQVHNDPFDRIWTNFLITELTIFGIRETSLEICQQDSDEECGAD